MLKYCLKVLRGDFFENFIYKCKNSTENEKPFGIKCVYVNGKIVLDGDKIEKDNVKTTGKAIRVK